MITQIHKELRSNLKKLNYLSKHMIDDDDEAIRKIGDLVLEDLLLQDMVVLNTNILTR
jgi:hypothetical protein